MRRIGNALLAAVLGVTGLGALVGAAGPAAAAGCPGSVTRGDLDGDGKTDTVVPMPWYDDVRGALDVRYTGRASQVVAGGSVGDENGIDTQFGVAVAVGDLDGDGCADLVVGSLRESGPPPPGQDQGYPQGGVHIVFGSPNGLVLSSAVELPYTSSSPTRGFDDFGAALAVVARPNSTNGTHDLYVGVPGYTVAGQPDAGGVARYVVTPSGTASRVNITNAGVRTQDSPGVPGTAENGDGLGTALTADERLGGVFASVPGEDVNGAVDAGAVTYFGIKTDGSNGVAGTYSQASGGVPGAPEEGDGFGTALSARGAYLAVGVPGEDVGKKKDAGLVQWFRLNGNGQLVVGKALTQDSKGIPGTAEAGDRFGASVAVGSHLYCIESVDVAAGAPGEDVGKKKDAGAVTLVSLIANCPAKVVRQGAGLGGVAEAGDRVGDLLGVQRGRTDLDSSYSDRLLISASREEIGAATHAGLVQTLKGGFTVNGAVKASLMFSGGAPNAFYYGMVASSSFD